MAVARQRRKSVWPGCALAAMLASLPALPLRAATTEYVVTDRSSGLAIYGFDPVAYFTDARPSQGSGLFEYRHAGVVWRFRNLGNRAAFAANPEVYAPQFGGYDPVALGRGAAVAGDPRLWVIAGERLYLFQSPENKAAFLGEAERIAAAAAEAWPAVQRTLTP